MEGHYGPLWRLFAFALRQSWRKSSEELCSKLAITGFSHSTLVVSLSATLSIPFKDWEGGQGGGMGAQARFIYGK